MQNFTSPNLADCKPQTLTLKNRLIGKFLGGSNISDVWHFTNPSIKPCKVLAIHKDWNMIMLVAEKIGDNYDSISITRDEGGDKVIILGYANNEQAFEIEETPQDTLIETVFDCMYQYVLWRQANPL